MGTLAIDSNLLMRARRKLSDIISRPGDWGDVDNVVSYPAQQLVDHVARDLPNNWGSTPPLTVASMVIAEALAEGRLAKVVGGCSDELNGKYIKSAFASNLAVKYPDIRFEGNSENIPRLNRILVESPAIPQGKPDYSLVLKAVTTVVGAQLTPAEQGRLKGVVDEIQAAHSPTH